MLVDSLIAVGLGIQHAPTRETALRVALDEEYPGLRTAEFQPELNGMRDVIFALRRGGDKRMTVHVIKVQGGWAASEYQVCDSIHVEASSGE